MTGPWAVALLVFAASMAAAAAATWAVLRLLERRAILDHPNERSSHARPTPRGGGIAVVAVIAVAWTALFGFDGAANMCWWLTLGGLVALAVVSWIDDLRDLSAAVRIVCHGAIVALVLACLPADATVFQGLLPPLADRIAAGFLWVWFINLFNFMDGIDGISGVEAIAIGGGVFALTAVMGTLAAGLPALALAGAVAGFLAWNWHPARLFLGDVGSVPLGFALGGLLLALAMAGHWAAALILPLYYLADATITLARRALRGEKVWRAHREHFYQRAVARGLGHDAVARAVALCDLALIGLAIAAELGGPTAKLAALAGAALGVALLLFYLAGGFRRAPIAPNRDV